MTQSAVREIARTAGIAVEWENFAGEPQQVPESVLRGVLAALSLPCDTSADIERSRETIRAQREAAPTLITAVCGERIRLPQAEGNASTLFRVTYEDGTNADLKAKRLSADQITLPPIAHPGYHALDIGDRQVTLAVAPPRCVTIGDIASGARLSGLAAQVYALRRRGDGGIGDMGAVCELADGAAAQGIDALALSPMHALFAADAGHFSPYSPSNRLFYNPLHADPRVIFGDERTKKIISNVRMPHERDTLETRPEIDWPAAAGVKFAILKRLFDEFQSHDMTQRNNPLATEFAQFCKSGGDLLREHAVFEALHATQLVDGDHWSWQQWPSGLRNPNSEAVRDFANNHEREVLYHSFLQWIAEGSLHAAKKHAQKAGMRLGLIADLAVGMNGSGSHAWSRQDDILVGLNVGAPPDLFNRQGQDWGLTTFSPRALKSNGFAPFIGTLRACLKHASGLRIDHVMGLMRLWVIPSGASPTEGAYLHYPLDDLLNLIALESNRHKAVIIGEDLGTVPPEFRERLTNAGIAGMRVLWFERDEDGFLPPDEWPSNVAAMTSTHDLPTVTGWWRGSDIGTRAELKLIADRKKEEGERAKDRAALWQAFVDAKVASGREPAPTQTSPVSDAAARFIAATPAQLALLPIEDALGLEHQPNLPGTIDTHPNWRRRYGADACTLLEQPAVKRRLQALRRNP